MAKKKKIETVDTTNISKEELIEKLFNGEAKIQTIQQQVHHADGSVTSSMIYGTDVGDGVDRSMNIFCEISTIIFAAKMAIDKREDSDNSPQKNLIINNSDVDYETTIDDLKLPLMHIVSGSKEKIFVKRYIRDERKTVGQPIQEDEFIFVGDRLETSVEDIKKNDLLAIAFGVVELRKILKERGILQKLQTIGNKSSGVYVSVNEDNIKARIVRGHTRPELPCLMFGGMFANGLEDAIMMRPYVDEFMLDAVHSKMSLKEKIAAAEDGDTDLMEELARYYLDKENIKYASNVAYWLKKLAEQEVAAGQFNLALLYAKGYGVERDFVKAAEWMQRARDNGDNDGESAAKKYMEMAGLQEKAKSGDVKAMTEFAVALIRMAGSLAQAGREKDDKEAIELARIVAQSGDTKSIITLATEFMKKGNELDGESGQSLYKAAVELAKAAGNNGEALWVLALAYEHGRGVEEDINKAIEYYKKGAELGHAPCQHSYGCFFLRGDYLDENKPLGVNWIQKSAKQGYELAEFALAKLYGTGDGIKKDLDKAVEWGEKVASRGNAEVQCEVAKIYASIVEGGRMYNSEKAKYWLGQAAEQGNQEAEKLLNNDKFWQEGGNIEAIEAAEAQALKKKAMDIMNSVIFNDDGKFRQLLLDSSRNCFKSSQEYKNISFEELCARGNLLFDINDIDWNTKNLCFIVTTAENTKDFSENEEVYINFDIIVKSSNNDLDGYKNRGSEICSYICQMLNGKKISGEQKLCYAGGKASATDGFCVASIMFTETNDEEAESDSNIFAGYEIGNRAIFERLCSNDQLKKLMGIETMTCEKAYEEGYFRLTEDYESNHKAWIILSREFNDFDPIYLTIVSCDKKTLKSMTTLAKHNLKKIELSELKYFEFDGILSQLDIINVTDNLFATILVLNSNSSII